MSLGSVPNNYITIDGLSFLDEGIVLQANMGNVHNWTIQNCDFKYALYGIQMNHYLYESYYWSDITVQSCTFDYCTGPSLCFENASNGKTFLRLNILNNVITHNNMIYDGPPWPDPWSDCDCIAIQNIKDSNIIGNDISGYIALMNGEVANGGITVWMGAGPSNLIIDGVTNDGTGKIKVSAHWEYNDGSWLNTGQRVALWGILDSALGTATTGTWTITVINSTSFVLNGSTFPTGHSYTAGSGAGRQEPDFPKPEMLLPRIISMI